MSEPKSRAKTIETIAPGILHWKVHDDRIESMSHAYAIEEPGPHGSRTTVLIDPLPLDEAALASLGKVQAIGITGSCHQRSAWRYRKQFKVKVYAPEGAQGLEETPDVWYRKGTKLPGNLEAIHAPGPTEVHYAFLHGKGKGALFCADILMRERETVRFISDEYQDDPQRTRETARRFLDLKFETLCFDHGEPITRNAHDAIRKALEAD